MILLVNEFGRVLREAGRQGGFLRKATAPWVFVGIAQKRCPRLALVSGLFVRVFLFCSKSTQDFAGVPPQPEPLKLPFEVRQ